MEKEVSSQPHTPIPGSSSSKTEIFLALCAEGVRGGSLYAWEMREGRRGSESPPT